MFKSWKKISLIALVLIIASLPFLIPFNSYKKDIESKVTNLIGRQFKIDGNINLSIFPVAIKLNQVRLASLPNFSEKDFIFVEQAKIILSILDMIKGRVVIKHIKLDSPIINFEVSKSGIKNWELQLPNSEEKKSGENNTSNNEPADEKFKLSVENIEIENGKIQYITDKDKIAINDINLKIDGPSPKGPIDIDLLFTAIDQKIKMHAKIDELTELLPVKLEIEVLNQLIQFFGNIDLKNNIVKGEVSSDGDIKDFKLGNVKAQDYQFVGNIEASKDLVTISGASFRSSSIGIKIAAKYDFNTNVLQGNINGERDSFKLGFVTNTQNKPLTTKLNFQSANIGKLLQTLQIEGATANLLNQNLALSTLVSYSDQSLIATDIIFNLGKAKIMGEVKLKDWAKNLAVYYDLKTENGSNLLEALKTQAPLAIKSLATKGSVVQNNKQYKINSSLNAFDTNIAINGEVEPAGVKSKFSLTLKSALLNLNNILLNTGSSKANVSSKRWPDDKINLSFIDQIDGVVNLQIDKLIKDQLVISEVKGKITCGSGSLRLDSMKGRIYEGIFNVSASVKGAVSQNITLKSELQNARLKLIAPQHAKFKITDGNINLNTELSTSGSSIKTYINNLQGNLVLEATNGIVSGINLNKIVDSLSNLKDWQTVATGITSSVKGGETKFKSLKSNISIKNGVATLHDTNLIADRVTANAVGSINLPQYSMNVSSNVTVQNFPSFNVYFSGMLDDPAVQLDITALQSYLVKNVLGGVIDSIKQGKTKPKDILKNIIGGNKQQVQDTATENKETKTNEVENAEDVLKKPGKVLENTIKSLFK